MEDRRVGKQYNIIKVKLGETGGNYDKLPVELRTPKKTHYVSKLSSKIQRFTDRLRGYDTERLEKLRDDLKGGYRPKEKEGYAGYIVVQAASSSINPKLTKIGKHPIKYKIVDGHHRIKLLKEMFDDDYEIEVILFGMKESDWKEFPLKFLPGIVYIPIVHWYATLLTFLGVIVIVTIPEKIYIERITKWGNAQPNKFSAIIVNIVVNLKTALIWGLILWFTYTILVNDWLGLLIVAMCKLAIHYGGIYFFKDENININMILGKDKDGN